MKPGQQITCFNDGWSILSVVGKNGRTFWFVFLKLKKECGYNEAPRYTKDDAFTHCNRLNAQTFWDTVTFGDVWSRREVFTMTPLEEGAFRQWTCGRIVCIGDSMHKVCLHDDRCIARKLIFSFTVCPKYRPGSQLCNRRCSRTSYYAGTNCWRSRTREFA